MMIFHFGYLLLFASLVVSISVLFYSLLFRQKDHRCDKKNESLMYSSILLVFLINLLVLLLIGWLSLSRNFESVYVTENVNASLPFFYRLTAVWAGQAGSLAVWNFLSMLFAYMTLRNKSLPREVFVITSRMFLLSSSFFSLILLFSDESNPFRYFVNHLGKIAGPADGNGMNPLLHHWAMIIHPPVLLIGYISIIIPYALMNGVWFTGKNSKTLHRQIKNWMIFSVFTLGIGIVLGALWSYDELGWGGYWSWDPVENASLIPFITAVVWLHRYSKKISLQRSDTGSFLWISFSYIGSMIGVFITRSGFISSVHAFGGTRLGVFFIIYIFVLVGILFRGLLYKKNERKVDQSSNRMSYLSLVLTAMVIILLWGSLFPGIYRLFSDSEITLKESWFNRWMGGAGALSFVLFLYYDYLKLPRKIFISLVGFSSILLIPFVYFLKIDLSSIQNSQYIFFISTLLILIALFLKLLLTLYSLVKQKKWFRERGSVLLIHLSFLLMIAGFGGKLLSYEESFTIKKGEAIRFENGIFSLVDFRRYKNVQTNLYLYESYRLSIDYYKDNRYTLSLQPEIRIYPVYDYRRNTYDKTQRTTEPAVARGFLYDIYLQFSGMNDDGSFHIKIIRNYFAVWVWAGFFLFVLSVFLYWREKKVFG